MGLVHHITGVSEQANATQTQLALAPASAKLRSDFHPTTVPAYEAPFWLEGKLIPSAADPFANCSIRLTRGWQPSGRAIDVLPVRFYSDVTRLGCTYIPNETLSEVYWSSKAAPKLLRWVWRTWHAWRAWWRVRGHESQKAGS